MKPKQMKTMSCGIIPYSVKDGVVLFFVGHPGGKPRNLWGMLKGQHEFGESFEETAVREFVEESGFDLSDYRGNLVFLGRVAQSRDKDVAAYCLYIKDISEINPDNCRSNMADGCPWPEIDDYKWICYNDIIEKTYHAHKTFYDKILNIVKNGGK